MSVDTRELDRAIAVEVMGWELRQNGSYLEWHPGPPSSPYLLGRLPVVYESERKAIDDLPQWSTTGDGMLAVIERMRERGWFHMTWSDDDGNHARFFLGYDPQDNDYECMSEQLNAPTAPQAVAEAALAAVRSESQ